MSKPGTMTLQINTAGAWRNVIAFPTDRRDLVLRRLAPLAQAFETQAKWALLKDDGTREWLDAEQYGPVIGAPIHWQWRHGSESGALSYMRDVLEYRAKWPDMQFWPVYLGDMLLECDFAKMEGAR